MGLATINIKFQADLRGFSTEMQNSMRRIGAFGNQMKAVGQGMSLYLTAPILGAGAAAIKFASDYNESLNKVDVSFKDSAAGVKDFAKTSLESFGIAESTALDLASSYGDMATSLDIPTDKAAKMSESLVGLAGDLASFKNISIDVANTALAAIFTGETESLKKLGIVMTEANLQNFAYSRGLKIKIADMDQASKVNLRYAYIMSVTKNAQGDFARTGGGAANQMRIFQESLKQVAQQFGSIMIPAFTKAIVYVNGLIKSFGSLSEGTKGMIITVAAVVSATGPLLTVFGSMLTFVPNLITKFNALKTTLMGVNAVIAANPYTAAAIAIGLIAAATYGWYSSTKNVITSQEALNKAVADGNKNAATEVGTLDKLYASATNLKLSINSRKEAVAKLQELYPAYFQNLDTENIKNGAAVGIYNELRNAIFNKARAVAVDLELQKRANDRIEKELQLRDNISKTEAEILRLKKGANEIVLQEANASEKTARVTISKSEAIAAQTKLLKKQQSDLANYNNANRGADEALFKAKETYSSKTTKLQENEVLKNNAVAGSIEGVTDATEKLKKSNLEPIEIKINTSAGGGNSDAFDAEIAKLKEFQTEVATTAEQVTLAEKAIKKVELAKALKFDPTSLIKISDGFDALVVQMQAKAGGLQSVAETMKATVYDLSATVAEAVTQLAVNAAVGFGEAIGSVLAGTQSLGSLFSGMLGLVANFMKDLGKQLIAIGIARIAFDKLKFSGVGAVVAGIALVALGTVVSAKFSNAGKFADGGIVGGSSYYGDKIMARVNSAEMISNTDQQKRIWGAMNGGGSGDIYLNGGFDISGDKLQLILERAEKRKKRIG